MQGVGCSGCSWVGHAIIGGSSASVPLSVSRSVSRRSDDKSTTSATSSGSASEDVDIPIGIDIDSDGGLSASETKTRARYRGGRGGGDADADLHPQFPPLDPDPYRLALKKVGHSLRSSGRDIGSFPIKDRRRRLGAVGLVGALRG